MDKYRNKLLYVLIVLVFLGVFWAWTIFSNANDSELLIAAETKDDIRDDASENLPQAIVVHISGAVKNPGVVRLSSESRLIEAIEEVGGLTDNADQNSVNLARRLKDEEKIHIYEIGEMVNQETGQSDGRVNINTASLEELKKLPGIGDVIAQGIIDYREKNGSFTDLEELKNVNRIGEKIYEGLSDLIVL